ncbi:MAG: hypothetical protein OEY49_19840 [Candidatus Heimdallarchaeota archaeon]|nr:hypothetical protein [Candidatus Heimdallarchaeota archaeon]
MMELDHFIGIKGFIFPYHSMLFSVSNKKFILLCIIASNAYKPNIGINIKTIVVIVGWRDFWQLGTSLCFSRIFNRWDNLI